MLPWHRGTKLFHCARCTVATTAKSVISHGMKYPDLSGITHINIDAMYRKKGQVSSTGNRSPFQSRPGR